MQDTQRTAAPFPETGPSAVEAAAGLLEVAGLDPAITERLVVTGSDPILPSIFRIGTAACAAIGAASLAVTEIWRERTGRAQDVSIEMRDAIAAYHAERWAVVPNTTRRVRGDEIGLGFYRTKDDRFIRFQTSMPHHRQAVLDVLQCENTRAAGVEAVRQWNAFELEDAVAKAGGIPAVVLTNEEWARHPQGMAVQSLPVIEITKIADSPPQPLTEADRPLSGIRVVDITRVISGPTCCRFLAGHGADVLRLSSPAVTDWGLMDIGTGYGKRSAWLDLRTDADVFGRLIDGADVLVQGMRPGVLASYGYGPEEAAARRPGLIYVSLSGFGHLGPWADRACYDSMLQPHNGMAHEGAAYRADGIPDGTPVQIMDQSTAYIAALGTLSALLRRAREGGSYHVRIALATTGEWIKQLGRVDGMSMPEADVADYDDLMLDMDTSYGPTRYVRHAERLSETPPFYARPTEPFGASPPAWD